MVYSAVRQMLKINFMQEVLERASSKMKTSSASQPCTPCSTKYLQLTPSTDGESDTDLGISPLVAHTDHTSPDLLKQYGYSLMP